MDDVVPSGRLEPPAIAPVREAAAACRRCDLWRNATQTVFGEGPVPAAMMLVGEQPGNDEDLAGRPFVGPAGRLLATALTEAGILRSRIYVTNAVKHFKNEPRGKRRLHKRPNAGEIDACRWWLDQELRLVRPRLVVALGATAISSLIGRSVPVSQLRGRRLPATADRPDLWVTVHPSYLLRVPDADARRVEFARFIDDLKAADACLGGA